MDNLTLNEDSQDVLKEALINLYCELEYLKIENINSNSKDVHNRKIENVLNKISNLKKQLK